MQSHRNGGGGAVRLVALVAACLSFHISPIAAGDQPDTALQLGLLADNGGPTQTMLPGSPAIDAGTAYFAWNGDGNLQTSWLVP